jgi:hypothetical protein
VQRITAAPLPPERCRFGRKDYSEVGVVNEVWRECGGSCRRVFVVYQPPVAAEERVFEPTHITEMTQARLDAKALLKKASRRKLVE